MQAVRFHAYGGPEQLHLESGVPEPHVGPRTVLIAAVAASVNPIDWKVRSGARQKDFPLTLPSIPGCDVSGTVRAVGVEVRNFKPGDRVLAMANATYAELVAADDAVVAHLPEGLDLIDAAAIPLAVLTGDQLVRQIAGIRRGEQVLVTGATGSVGRAAVLAARRLGARVYAGARARSLEAARRLGADEVVALDDAAALARLPPLDAIADTVGGPLALQLIGRLRPGGRFAYASFIPEGTAALRPDVTVARVFAKPDASKIREYADAIRDGQFTLPIGRRLPLSAAGEGQALCERGGVGKIILLVATP